MATPLANGGALRALGLTLTMLIVAGMLAPSAAALTSPVPVDGRVVPKTVDGFFAAVNGLARPLGIPVVPKPCPGLGAPPCACGPYPPFNPQTGDGMWIC